MLVLSRQNSEMSQRQHSSGGWASAPLLARPPTHSAPHAITQFTGFMSFLCWLSASRPEIPLLPGAWRAAGRDGQQWVATRAVGGLADSASRLHQHQWKVYNYTNEGKRGWWRSGLPPGRPLSIVAHTKHCQANTASCTPKHQSGK